MNRLAELEALAGRLRNHIKEIRIDFPEAADARRGELARVNKQISELRRALADANTGKGGGDE